MRYSTFDICTAAVFEEQMGCLHKGCCQKIPFINFDFAISMLKRPWNFKTLVPFPHNTPIIMNFKVLRSFDHRYCKN